MIVCKLKHTNMVVESGLLSLRTLPNLRPRFQDATVLNRDLVCHQSVRAAETQVDNPCLHYVFWTKVSTLHA